MLTTTGRAPKDFSLGSVKLQPIGAHPRRHFIDADRQLEGEIINVIRPTGSVNLGVVGIGVWERVGDVLSAARGQQRTVEREWGPEPTLEEPHM